ncbi:hypothetical protein KIL84_019108 [Mauremys mutica]|uniref:Uncharacterized protein n=1 Tax=Mauremys mutica TaxID=74926 RepID=A0A9D4BAX7_9SAUR|nr:hypothetical protein KIL84_019108 [Mauremys mutica]
MVTQIKLRPTTYHFHYQVCMDMKLKSHVIPIQERKYLKFMYTPLSLPAFSFWKGVVPPFSLITKAVPALQVLLLSCHSHVGATLPLPFLKRLQMLPPSSSELHQILVLMGEGAQGSLLEARLIKIARNIHIKSKAMQIGKVRYISCNFMIRLTF